MRASLRRLKPSSAAQRATRSSSSAAAAVGQGPAAFRAPENVMGSSAAGGLRPRTASEMYAMDERWERPRRLWEGRRGQANQDTDGRSEIRADEQDRQDSEREGRKERAEQWAGEERRERRGTTERKWEGASISGPPRGAARRDDRWQTSDRAQRRPSSSSRFEAQERHERRPRRERSEPSPARIRRGPPPRLPLHPITPFPPRGKPTLLRTPVTLHTLSQPPHFPYTLPILGSLLAPIASHNERRSDDQFWADSSLARQAAQKAAQERMEAKARGEDPGPPVQPERDSLWLPLAHPWLHEERRKTRPKRFATINQAVAFPHATFGERYYLWRGKFPRAARRGGAPLQEQDQDQDRPWESDDRWAPAGSEVEDSNSLEVEASERDGESEVELDQGSERRRNEPVELTDDPSSHWAILLADVDSEVSSSSPGLIDLRFYSSDEAWLLLESRGWAYDAASGRLRDTGAAIVTNTPLPEGDEGGWVAGRGERPMSRDERELQAAGCEPALGMNWWNGQQALTGMLNEWSLFRRPLRLSNINQLWVPTIHKIASYLRVRPQKVETTYFRRFVLPPDAPILKMNEVEVELEVERRLGMKLDKLRRRELNDLTAPLRQNLKYLYSGNPFSSALRPLASTPSAQGVLYAAQTINTDLSLAPPLVLPQHAQSGLHEIVLGRTARLVHRALTQTVDESSQVVDNLSALVPDRLPVHAKIPVSDEATAAVLRATGWKEVYGGAADIFLDEWEEVSDEQFQLERGERRTGLSLEEREKLREDKRLKYEEEKAEARAARADARYAANAPEGGDGEGEGGEAQPRDRYREMQKSMKGVFSHPEKMDKWDI